jgi:hypothetical protein
MSCGRVLAINTKVKGNPVDYAKRLLKLDCMRAGCTRPIPLQRTEIV